MKKSELMALVGKKVRIYFKGWGKSIYGTLYYADDFSAKHAYRLPNYFYIGNTAFKVSHIRKVESEDK